MNLVNSLKETAKLYDDRTAYVFDLMLPVMEQIANKVPLVENIIQRAG